MKVEVATRLACDFCEKTQDEVKKLIRGERDACICDECVALCQEILDGTAAKAEATDPIEQAG